VPMESAVSLDDIRIVPMRGNEGLLHLGIQAPDHIQILRDDAKRRTAS